MGVTNSNKELNVTQINCDGSFKIKLSLTAAPDITTNPTDIVLILDRSGSMEGATFEFTVTHIGPCVGTVEVNESITYDDEEGNIVSFPSPAIEVDYDFECCCNTDADA